MGISVFKEGWQHQSGYESCTVCGRGSSPEFTKEIRKRLTGLLSKYNIQTMNDAGCGDLAWMRTLNLGSVDYMGYDAHSRESWKSLNQSYPTQVLDITNEPMRKADLVLCRDVFIHLPNTMILQALVQFRESAKYLLTSTFTSSNETTFDGANHSFSNFDRMAEPSLRHAKLDLTLPPFSLGVPLESFQDDYPHKYLALWDLHQTHQQS